MSDLPPGTKTAGLSFPDDADWFRGGHVINSGPVRCNKTVVIATETEAVTLSHWTESVLQLWQENL